MDKFDYPPPYEIYINRQRQMRNYEKAQGYLMCAFIALALMWFGIAIARVMA